MVARYLTCPLCGFEFEQVDTLCAHGCPLGKLCNLVRCPSCAYEFPKTSQRVSWLRRMFTRQSPIALHVPADVRRLCDLHPGERATVKCLGGDRASRHNTLAVFGLLPGAEVTLVQQRPSCVVQVGETQLALDSDIAEEILVR